MSNMNIAKVRALAASALEDALDGIAGEGLAAVSVCPADTYVAPEEVGQLESTSADASWFTRGLEKC